MVHFIQLLAIFSIGFFSREAEAFGFPSAHRSLSMSSKPKGCAAVPYNKKKVAVFGTGGYMGATVFGFIQRASSIYGTGLGGISAPRSICATPIGSDALNKVLLRTFKLAFAGEDMIRLTDMQDTDAISQRLKGIDAAVLGTVYQMEKKSVALGSYEKSPNDKTYEFYLDDKYGADWEISPDDMDTHLTMFKNSVDACKAAGLEHIVVIETPSTQDAKPFAKILDDACVPFTYISVNGQLETSKLYTFEEGIQADHEINGFTLGDNYMTKGGYTSGDWSDTEIDGIESSDVVAREDVAALAVQSLMSLEWTKSRRLTISAKGLLEKMSMKEKNKLKSDKDWCLKSEVLAANLASSALE
jgi:hypothetical protein